MNIDELISLLHQLQEKHHPTTPVLFGNLFQVGMGKPNLILYKIEGEMADVEVEGCVVLAGGFHQSVKQEPEKKWLGQ